MANQFTSNSKPNSKSNFNPSRQNTGFSVFRLSDLTKANATTMTKRKASDDAFRSGNMQGVVKSGSKGDIQVQQDHQNHHLPNEEGNEGHNERIPVEFPSVGEDRGGGEEGVGEGEGAEDQGQGNGYDVFHDASPYPYNEHNDYEGTGGGAETEVEMEGVPDHDDGSGDWDLSTTMKAVSGTVEASPQRTGAGAKAAGNGGGRGRGKGSGGRGRGGGGRAGGQEMVMNFGNGTEDVIGVKRKRLRRSLNCSECQRRKVKCSRTHPCESCIKHNIPHLCQWNQQIQINGPDDYAPIQTPTTRFTSVSGQGIGPSTSSTASTSTSNTTGKKINTKSRERERKVMLVKELGPGGNTIPVSNPTCSIDPNVKAVGKGEGKRKETEMDSSWNETMVGGADSNSAMDFENMGDEDEEECPDEQDKFPSLEELAQYQPRRRSQHENAQPFILGSQYSSPSTSETNLPTCPTSIFVGPSSLDRANPNSNFTVDPFCNEQARVRLYNTLLGVMPNQEMANHLVAAYEKRVHAFVRAIHLPTFNQEYACFWEARTGKRNIDWIRNIDPLFLALIFMVFCLPLDAAMCYNELPKPLTPYSEEELVKMPEIWFKASQACLRLADSTGRPRFRTIQTTVLYGMYLRMNADSIDGHRYAHWNAVGLQTALSMGLHRLGSDPTTMPPLDPALPLAVPNTLARELAKRCFNTLVSSNWAYATTTKSYLIHPSYVTTDQTGNYDESDLHADRITAPKSDNQYSDSAYERWKYHVGGLMRDIVDTIGVTGVPVPHDRALQFANHLKKDFLDRIQPELDHPSFELERKKPEISWLKHLIREGVHNRIVRLHWTWMERGYTDPRYQESVKLCIHSANEILAAEKALVDQPTKYLFFTYHHLLSSCFVFANDLWHSMAKKKGKSLPPRKVLLDKLQLIRDGADILARGKHIRSPAIRISALRKADMLNRLCEEASSNIEKLYNDSDAAFVPTKFAHAVERAITALDSSATASQYDSYSNTNGPPTVPFQHNSQPPQELHSKLSTAISPYSPPDAFQPNAPHFTLQSNANATDPGRQTRHEMNPFQDYPYIFQLLKEINGTPPDETYGMESSSSGGNSPGVGNYLFGGGVNMFPMPMGQQDVTESWVP